MQKLMKIYSDFGNGDIGMGKKIIADIADRLEHARQKHPKKEWQKMNVMQAFNALNEEKQEVCKAICHETEERMKSELLDLMVVAVRIYNGEYGDKDTVIPEQAKQKFMKKFEEKE